MNFSVNNENGISTLFSSLNNSSSSGLSGLSDILSEYNSIKNGSYAKLAKQYYAKSTDGKSTDTSWTKNTGLDSTFKGNDEATITQNKAIISDVSSFRSAVSEIKKADNLFDKTTVKGSDGSEKIDYNYDAIYAKLDKFVKEYNSVVASGAESDNEAVLRNTLNMTNAVKHSNRQLASAGFTINSDNTLSVSKKSLQNANMDVTKQLFSSGSTFMRQLDSFATNIASSAASDVYSLGGYNSTGAYKQTLESIYNTTI